jgi:probable rRNA maturation factor
LIPLTSAPKTITIEFTKDAGAWPKGLQQLAERAVAATLTMCGHPVIGPAELSVLLTDDAAQAKLNRQWRNQDKSTNVLSFPTIEATDPIAGLIGDISLAYETVEREAKGLGKSLDDHFTHLLIHGLLHCLGHDHVTEDEAQIMENLETRILASLNIADPYSEGLAMGRELAGGRENE